MNTFKKLSLVAAAISLAACGSLTLPNKLKKEVSAENERQLSRVTDYDMTPNIFHFDSFYVPTLSEKERSLPEWVFASNDLKTRQSTVGKVTRYLESQHGFSSEFRIGASPDKPTIGVHKADNVGELLDLVASSTGYQYDIIDNTLVWRKYSEEVFPIRAVPGTYDYSIGKRLGNQNQQNNAGGGLGGQNNFAQAGAVSNNGDEYSNVSGSINPINEYLQTIEAMLGCGVNNDSNTQAGQQAPASQNSVSEDLELIAAGGALSPEFDDTMNSRCAEGAEVRAFHSDNSVYVRALPSQMDSVRAFVESKTERAMRSLRVDITLLTVTTNDSSVLDLSLNVQDILDNASSNWSTVSNAAQSVVGGLTEAGSLSVNHNSGTQAVIQALDERGDILQKTVIRGIALNNRIGNFTNVDKVSFIADRRLQTTSNVGATTGIEQQVAESGILLYMLPNIGKDNAVIHLSTSLSDLVTITKKGEVGNEVESPEISDRLFNTTMVLEPGRPVLAGGSTVREIQSVNAVSGVSGYSQSGLDKKIEIMMIVEATFL